MIRVSVGLRPVAPHRRNQGRLVPQPERLCVTKKHKSLSEYAYRRYRLAGSAILEEHGNPFFAPTDTLKAEIQGRGNGHFVSFANYDYLGLAEHPEVKAAAHQAIDTLGVGALASRLVGGERSTHQKFEDDLAKFLGTEATLSLVSGYLTNLTVITHLMAKRDAIFLDELSHNSVATGARNADADKIVFVQKTTARTLGEVIEGADVFLGLSAGGVFVNPRWLRAAGIDKIYAPAAEHTTTTTTITTSQSDCGLFTMGLWNNLRHSLARK